MKTNPACAVALVVLLCLAAPLPVGAWSINTHMYSAAVILDDMRDDGMLQVNEVIHNDDGTIEERPLAPIPVPDDIREAVLAFPECFFGGSCGPDGYPDIYVGQSIIHPYEPGQHWRAIQWAEHVLKYARKYSSGEKRQKAIAYAAGFLVHYAGDGFGHTWVNAYDGGCWDWGNMDLVCKHVAVESWVNSKLPWDGPPKLDVDPSFLRDALMIHEDVHPSIVRSGFLEALVDYYRGLDHGVDKCNDTINDEWAWAYGAAETALLLKPYLVDLRNDADRALYEWGETSSRALREMADGNVARIPVVISEWGGDWLLDLALGIPSVVENLLDILGMPMDWITMPISDRLGDLVSWLWDHVGKGPFERALNPEVFMRDCYTEAQRAQVDEDLHLAEGGGKLEPSLFKPLHDTIALGKLALTTPEGIESIGTQLGVKIPYSGSSDNLLWHCISSLDASNQLGLYPKIRLLDTDELKGQAYRHLFRTDPYEQTASQIDPNHVLLALIPGGRVTWFGVPLPDPGAADTVVKGYVYTGTGGSLRRDPIFEEPIPTSGTTGVYADLIRTSWESRVDRLTTYHLCTARPAAGTTDIPEDLGVDVVLNVSKQELPDTMGGEGMDAAMAQMMQGGEFAARMAELMAKAGQAGAPNADEIRAQMEAFMAAMAAAQAKSGTAGLPGDPTDPLVMPSSTVGKLIENINNPPTPPEDMPEEMRERMEAARAATHMVIGVVKDAEGEPVPQASVTLVQASLYNDLKTKATTAVPVVRLDLWCPGKYNMARTNDQGQFAMAMVDEGGFMLTATALGKPRLVKPLNLNFAGKMGVILPAVQFGGAAGGGEVAEATAAAAGGAAPPPPGGADFGQLVRPPSFLLEPEARFLNYAQVRTDGRVELKVLLRPLSHFSGPVELSVDGLPAGVTAAFPENPVNLLDKPKQVSVLFKAAPEVVERAQLTLRATSGDLTQEAPVMVALARGRLEMTPARLSLKPGKTVKVRLAWTGAGEAVKLVDGKLPEGLSVRVDTVQWHPEMEPVRLAEVSIAKLKASAEVFRDREPKLVKYPVVLPPITADRIRQAPAMLLQKGLRLAPGGWAEAQVTVAAGTEPGKYTIPFKCRVGQLVTEQKLEVTVSR